MKLLKLSWFDVELIHIVFVECVRKHACIRTIWAAGLGRSILIYVHLKSGILKLSKMHTRSLSQTKGDSLCNESLKSSIHAETLSGVMYTHAINSLQSHDYIFTHIIYLMFRDLFDVEILNYISQQGIHPPPSIFACLSQWYHDIP